MRNPPVTAARSQAEFYSGFTSSIVPLILAKELACETAGKSELGHVGLRGSFAVKRANHRVQQVRDQ